MVIHITFSDVTNVTVGSDSYYSFYNLHVLLGGCWKKGQWVHICSFCCSPAIGAECLMERVGLGPGLCQRASPGVGQLLPKRRKQWSGPSILKVELPCHEWGLGSRKELHGGQGRECWHPVPPREIALRLGAGGEELCSCPRLSAVEFAPCRWEEGSILRSDSTESCCSYSVLIYFLNKCFSLVVYPQRLFLETLKGYL